VLDARAVAFLGIGRTPPLVGRIGLWDADPAITPDFFPSGKLQPDKKSRLRHAARAETALRLRCAVSASARLALPASVAVDAATRLNSTASLRIGATAEMAAGTAIEAAADVRDVVLEMLLLAD
jgi:hypothetical protein